MSTPVRNIVVGVAPAAGEHPALDAALQLAAAVGATLHVVRAYEPFTALGAPLTPEYAAALVQASSPEAMRALLEEDVRARTDYAPLELCAAAGSAEAVLADYAERVRAELLVVGARRHGPVGRALLGGTAKALIREAEVPVLVVHEPFRHPLRRVLLSTDLSDLSALVHERALDLVEQLFPGAEPQVASVLVIGAAPALPAPLQGDVLGVADQELTRWLRSRRPRPYRLVGRVRKGEARGRIVAEARESRTDLLVLGTHARRGVRRLLAGSVAAGVVAAAQCNVLVIPALRPLRHPSDRPVRARRAPEPAAG
ncbi:MAG TPA: universal stress protein [Longimicrobium sp.]|nr:universal stress protein [Longimicrobium sp.]